MVYDFVKISINCGGDGRKQIANTNLSPPESINTIFFLRFNDPRRRLTGCKQIAKRTIEKFTRNVGRYLYTYIIQSNPFNVRRSLFQKNTIRV